MATGLAVIVTPIIMIISAAHAHVKLINYESSLHYETVLIVLQEHFSPCICMYRGCI